MSVHICFRLTKLRPYIGTNIFRRNDTDQIRKTHKIVGILMRRRLRHKKKRCRSRPGGPKLVSWPPAVYQNKMHSSSQVGDEHSLCRHPTNCATMHRSPPTRRRPSRQRYYGSSLDWLLGYHNTNRPRDLEGSGLGSGSRSSYCFGRDPHRRISTFSGGTELQAPTC